MEKVRSVGVKELKNKLSEYLAQVRLGTRILVTDRNEVIAELQSAHLPRRSIEKALPLLQLWGHEGKVKPSRRALSKLGVSPLKISKRLSHDLIRETRGD